MTQLIEALRATAAKWRAGNQEHRGGVVLKCGRGMCTAGRMNCVIWKANALASTRWTRPNGATTTNGAKAWVAVDPDQE